MTVGSFWCQASLIKVSEWIRGKEVGAVQNGRLQFMGTRPELMLGNGGCTGDNVLVSVASLQRFVGWPMRKCYWIIDDVGNGESAL